MSRYSEKTNRRKSSKWQSTLLLVALLVLAGYLGSVWLTGKNYSDEKIIEKYFKSPDVEYQESNIPGDPFYLDNQNHFAEKSVKKGKYKTALNYYEIILEQSHKEVYDMAPAVLNKVKWNQILMLSATDQPQAAIDSLKLLLEFDIDENMKKEGEELLATYRSFWYGWAN